MDFTCSIRRHEDSHAIAKLLATISGDLPLNLQAALMSAIHDYFQAVFGGEK